MENTFENALAYIRQLNILDKEDEKIIASALMSYSAKTNRA